MKVPVTGNGGYIGDSGPDVSEAGHEVVGPDTHLYRPYIFRAEPVTISEIVKDLRDAEASDLDEFDAIQWQTPELRFEND